MIAESSSRNNSLRRKHSSASAALDCESNLADSNAQRADLGPGGAYNGDLAHYERAIEEAKRDADVHEELVVQSKQQAKLDSVNGVFKKAKNLVMIGDAEQENDHLEEEIESNFGMMNSCLQNLKNMSLDMKEELDVQTFMIGDLHGAIDKTDEDTEKVTRAMRRFEV